MGMQKQMATWWGRLAIAIVSFVFAYFFALWAINSGRILEYAAFLLLGLIGINRLAASIKTVFKR